MLEAMKKRIAKGISDFKKFITENGYFVDKTHLIKYLIDNPSEVHLITRPRRFGKTLNLSMIRYFFEAPLPESHGGGPPNGPLFDGLAISSRPECMEYMGQYPVIHLSFKDVKGAAHDECMGIIRKMLSAEYHRHEYLQNLNVLDEEEQAFFTKMLHKKGTDQDCAQSIEYLSAWLKRAYSKPAYILLDEYDTPLHGAYVNNFYDEMIRFIRSFMVQTFKDNPHLKQAVVIGILKVAQESIFSDFNNPQVSTLLDSAMKDCFGFTEAEVEAMAESFGQAEKMTGIREWYNGYVFGSDTTIYNPWSIINDISVSVPQHTALRMGCVPTGSTPATTPWSGKCCGWISRPQGMSFRAYSGEKRSGKPFTGIFPIRKSPGGRKWSGVSCFTADT